MQQIETCQKKEDTYPDVFLSVILNWCRLGDVLQTTAVRFYDNARLKDLVEEVGLQGDLIPV